MSTDNKTATITNDTTTSKEEPIKQDTANTDTTQGTEYVVEYDEEHVKKVNEMVKAMAPEEVGAAFLSNLAEVEKHKYITKESVDALEATKKELALLKSENEQLRKSTGLPPPMTEERAAKIHGMDESEFKSLPPGARSKLVESANKIQMSSDKMDVESKNGKRSLENAEEPALKRFAEFSSLLSNGKVVVRKNGHPDRTIESTNTNTNKTTGESGGGKYTIPTFYDPSKSTKSAGEKALQFTQNAVPLLDTLASVDKGYSTKLTISKNIKDKK